MKEQFRTEKDYLGEKILPANSLYGINTQRAIENFPLSADSVHPSLITAYGYVKLAAAETIKSLGYYKNNPKIIDAVIRASTEMSQGNFNDHIKVDTLQGGAGTSTNMNVNEVIANRALQILGEPPGSYDIISPLDDVNRFQSTNDTYPTALKMAAIKLIQKLELNLVDLQEQFQKKEKEFAHIVKIGRTQFQDAVLTTLGREMSAYADALNRDRWRIYKCQERLRVINLGGTAIGTGLNAPKRYIFRVTEKLRDLTGISFARAENLVDCTQNADVYTEVSGIIKACAVTLLKISTDLRILSSGPEGGFNEIILPRKQVGSSIMPGKINPVIPEAVSQAAMLYMGHDQTIANACSMGNLELNPFLPIVAHCLLKGIEILSNACKILNTHCIKDLKANQEKCSRNLENSTAVVTALVSNLGYERCSEIAKMAEKQNKSVRQIVLEQKLMNEEKFDELLSPEAVCRLGY